MSLKSSWLFPYRPFDVQAFFKRIGSPRLTDMPDLPAWVECAARQYDIRAEWLCGLIQKEQSGLTKATLSAHAQKWLCGFGKTDGPEYPQFAGARNQVFSAAYGLRRYLTPGDPLYVGDWVGRAKTFGGETRTINSLVEAVCLQYTPYWSTLTTVERIWQQYGFEDGGETMARLSPPLKIGTSGFGLRYNNTLHGRSVYRPQDIPGHNVFKGYSTWASNGHRGVGDGLDCFGPARTPVYAMHDGVQTVWRNDTQKLEVIYIEGGGITTVYAHIDATHEATGVRIKRGELVGYVRGDLKDPHLHLEVWVDGKAVSSGTPATLATKLIALTATAPAPSLPPVPKVILGRLQTPNEIKCGAKVEDSRLRCHARDLVEGMGLKFVWNEEQQKGYVDVTADGMQHLLKWMRPEERQKFGITMMGAEV